MGYFLYAWCRNYERYFSGEVVRKGGFGDLDVNTNTNPNKNENQNGTGNGKETVDGIEDEETQLRLAGKGDVRRGRARSEGKKKGERRRGGFRALKAVLRRCCLALAAAWRGFWARMWVVTGVCARQPMVQRDFPILMTVETENLPPSRESGTETEEISGFGL